MKRLKAGLAGLQSITPIQGSSKAVITVKVSNSPALQARDLPTLHAAGRRLGHHPNLPAPTAFRLVSSPSHRSPRP